MHTHSYKYNTFQLLGRPLQCKMVCPGSAFRDLMLNIKSKTQIKDRDHLKLQEHKMRGTH